MKTFHPKRLAAVPWAAFCIHCQEAVDRNSQEFEMPVRKLLHEEILLAEGTDFKYGAAVEVLDRAPADSFWRTGRRRAIISSRFWNNAAGRSAARDAATEPQRHPQYRLSKGSLAQARPLHWQRLFEDVEDAGD